MCVCVCVCRYKQLALEAELKADHLKEDLLKRCDTHTHTHTHTYKGPCK